MLSKIFLPGALTLMLMMPLAAGAMSVETDAILNNPEKTTEIYVDKSGKVVVSGAKVIQLAGRSFFTRLYWGTSYVRMLVKTNPDSAIVRATGESIPYTDIAVGDYLNARGYFDSGTESLILVADSVKDVSIQKGQVDFSGTVTGANSGSNTISVATKKEGVVTIAVGTTTKVIKGSRVIDVSRVAPGDKITSAFGLYDYPTKTLSATQVVVYLDPALYKSQNYQGTLLTAPEAASDGATFRVKIAGATYRVLVPSDSPILTNKRAPTSLERFVVGDTIRIFGKRLESDELVMEAYLIRNLNL